MKRFLVLNLICGVLIGLSALCQTASAAPVNFGVCDFVLANDCNSLDATSVPTSDKISVNSAGVWTSTCLGTTGAKPTKATKCDGETLNGSMGDPAPQFACELRLFGDDTETGPVFTDDWSETITPSGNVKMTCKFDPKETGK
jgi:hypothetical protein